MSDRNQSADDAQLRELESAGQTGCCHIESENGSETISGISLSACRERAKERGGTFSWEPGPC